MESLDVVAVLFDFGGVMTSSPFDAFAKFESEKGLPQNTIRKINSTNSDSNAWALLERSEVDADAFAVLFGREARGLGFQIDGKDVLALLQQEIRPEMVAALRKIKAAGFKTACLTNNIRSGESHGVRSEVMGLFDCVIESAVLGIRKPEIGFYTAALEALGVQAHQAVFLDDLGVNLKPARQMGMTTVKVTDSNSALVALEEILAMELR